MSKKDALSVLMNPEILWNMSVGARSFVNTCWLKKANGDLKRENIKKLEQMCQTRGLDFELSD